MNVIEQHKQMPGLDFLRHQIATGDQSSMAQLFGMRIVEAEDGHSVIEVEPSDKYYNPMGRVHGGFAATVLDSALGTAIMTKMAAGVGYGTVNLSINYVRKIDIGTGVMRAEGRVLHAGRTMFTAEAKLVDSAGKLYAHGNGTFLIYPKQS